MTHERVEVILEHAERSVVACFGTCVQSRLCELDVPRLQLFEFPALSVVPTLSSPGSLGRRLVISHHAGNQQSVLLGHSPSCPALLEPIPIPPSGHYLRIAVCVMIVHRGHVLLERRGPTMRTFPLRWVFPGGHVDEGESFLDAALREVQEEVGLSLAPSLLAPLAMWESCFPSQLTEGPLHRQHIVFYFKASLPESDQRPSLVLQPAEVDMAAWIPLQELHEHLIPRQAPSQQEMLSMRPRTFSALRQRAPLSDQYDRVDHHYSSLFPMTVPTDGSPQEGISTGTRFVLVTEHCSNSSLL